MLLLVPLIAPRLAKDVRTTISHRGGSPSLPCFPSPWPHCFGCLLLGYHLFHICCEVLMLTCVTVMRFVHRFRWNLAPPPIRFAVASQSNGDPSLPEFCVSRVCCCARGMPL
jgi:hypothetical protein